MAFIHKFLSVIPGGNLKKGMDCFNRGDYEKAYRYFEKYISRHSNYFTEINRQELTRMYMSESYIEYSKQLRKSGELELAAEVMEKVAEMEPEYADVHLMIGEMHEKLGNLERAEYFTKKSLSINPKFFKARVFISKIKYLSNQPRESVELLTRSRECTPGFYLNKVNQLIMDIRNSEPRNQVLELFTNILRERPTSAQVSKQVASGYIQEGEYDEAISELKKALSITPDFPDLRNLLGIAYANKGLKDDAIVEFNTALKINPDYLKVHLNLALTYYEKGAYAESSRHLDRVIEKDPDNELVLTLKEELASLTS
ncbi:MAG: tetratricopeptide repeat protein [Candidatus Latescibacteria bacterium]|nr:tetratricopeptide repeat protein [Candidatus Latescibacterota bacterium]